jgi:Ulp1 family protease
MILPVKVDIHWMMAIERSFRPAILLQAPSWPVSRS